ncbi:MAG: hypothetical protein JST92_12625 [Deltaproteobacteria bacterium]|nr:hypothetical protein [Deltaproteobacteria bacterium]
MPAYPRRLPHVLTRADLAVVLAPTYAKSSSVDEEEALERLQRAFTNLAIADELYSGIAAALAASKGTRTTEEEQLDKLSAGVQARRHKAKAADVSPAMSAAFVKINLELGFAPEPLRAALESPKGQTLLKQGLQALGAYVVKELIK